MHHVLLRLDATLAGCRLANRSATYDSIRRRRKWNTAKGRQPANWLLSRKASTARSTYVRSCSAATRAISPQQFSLLPDAGVPGVGELLFALAAQGPSGGWSCEGERFKQSVPRRNTRWEVSAACSGRTLGGLPIHALPLSTPCHSGRRQCGRRTPAGSV